MARVKPTTLVVSPNEKGRMTDPSEDGDVRIPEVEVPIRDADRQLLIAEAAYYRAEKRGFEPGHDLEDWLAAEADATAGRVIAARD